MIILEENLKWHLEAFASELFICQIQAQLVSQCIQLFLLCRGPIHAVLKWQHLWDKDDDHKKIISICPSFYYKK